jgi:hypothetical protein
MRSRARQSGAKLTHFSLPSATSRATGGKYLLQTEFFFHSRGPMVEKARSLVDDPVSSDLLPFTTNSEPSHISLDSRRFLFKIAHL